MRVKNFAKMSEVAGWEGKGRKEKEQEREKERKEARMTKDERVREESLGEG